MGNYVSSNEMEPKNIAICQCSSTNRELSNLESVGNQLAIMMPKRSMYCLL
jgi:hypothetical protein